MRVDEELELYKRRFRREQEEGENHPAVIAMYADGMARCYAYLGDMDKAKHYFQIAADACIDSLPSVKGKITQVDYALRVLDCARDLWWIGDQRAEEFFHRSLEEFQQEYDNTDEASMLFSWVWSSVPYIFLEDYTTARKTVNQSIDNIERSEVKMGGKLSDLIAEVIDACEKDTETAYGTTLSIVEKFIKEQKMGFTGLNSSPVVDLYEFVRQKLESVKGTN